MKHVHYLIKSSFSGQVVGRELRDDEVTYFVTTVEVEPWTHPFRIRLCIDEKAKELGLENNFNESIAQWVGDIHKKLDDVNEKLSSDSNWISGYERELKETQKSLSVAVKLIDNGQVNPF